MTLEQTQWVEGQKLWLAAQRVAINQTQANIDYNRREIELHQQAIDAAEALNKHYEDRCALVELELQTFIKDNPE